MHVIAIGASAGGLQAIREFFTYKQHSAGEAYVVILHAPRTYKGQLAKILARTTAMPVVFIEHGMRIRPGTIHVSPSSDVLDLENGVFRLTPRAKEHVINHTINYFFRSLARDVRAEAVGIIMSGTGTDGTDGARSIEDNGGLVIVQDPDTALFDGMPMTSIRYDHPDYVLPPKEMPALIDCIVNGTEIRMLRKHRSQN